jgi:hypothetical protein
VNGFTKEFDDFRCRHSLRLPVFIGSQWETMALQQQDGLRLLGPAPAANVLPGTPPSSSNETTNRYLWVIDTRGIPYIIDAPAQAVGHRLPKHTNLTGGMEAYLGGEMWFNSSTALYVSGGSGRYPPTDRRQLAEAIRVFQAFGYEVSSLGWNDVTGRAKRVLDTA